METEMQQIYPPLIRRFQSLFIDQMFIIFCMVMLSKIFSNESEESTGALRGILLIALFFAYEPFCMAFGCSLGNYICGIRVRQFMDHSKRINIINSYARFIVKICIGVISFFTVTSDEYKRAMHDQVARSIMLYAKKK
jgi:hypothetical protein